MFCSECGEKLSEGMKFCPNCGTKATRKAPSINNVSDNGMQIQTNAQQTGANVQTQASTNQTTEQPYAQSTNTQASNKKSRIQ